MRLSTIFVSFVFVLAGTSTALPVKVLVARFADSDFLPEVEARAYGDELELYARGGAVPTDDYKLHSRHRRSFYEPPRYELTRRLFDESLELGTTERKPQNPPPPPPPPPRPKPSTFGPR